MGKWGSDIGLDPELVARMIREHRERPEPPLVRLGPLGEVRINYTRFLREAFVVDPLPPGALTIYAKDPDLDITSLVAGSDEGE